jgi:hypothetical protein
MKEENLLIFRDLSVKFGSFGLSIKMKELPLKDGDSDEYQIKGLTPNYTTDLIKASLEHGENVSRKDLILNDYHALFKTFDDLYQ